jgi:hypothetical protein
MTQKIDAIPAWINHTYSDPQFRIPWDYPVDSFHIMLGIISARYAENLSPIPTTRPIRALRSAPIKPSKNRKRNKR